jgi:4-alpha-glucanotransferase
MYNQMGQNWSQPPWRPDALAQAGFKPYRDMLRTILRHAGGIRVDHVLGLFRLWWVPDGMPAYSGTFVTSDHEALVGILLLEAQRAGAWLVGEDLGTVEQWVQDYLSSRGVLGTTIMWFEKDYTRHPEVPAEPERWRANALASVTVHDLPPTAGYVAGEHVRIRAELGLLTRSEAAERAAHAGEIAEWRQLCIDRGLLAETGDEEDLIVALHALVAQSPSLLVGVALTDAVGDRRAQNQPGTDQEYPNWRVPLTDAAGEAVLLESFPQAPLLQRLVAAVRDPEALRVAVKGTQAAPEEPAPATPVAPAADAGAPAKPTKG